jgi:NAD+ synthase (glutamine-hydrolysing)
MTRHRLGAAFLNQTPLAWEENSAHLRAALDEARQRGVALLCLPELAVTGYGCEDAFLSPWLRKRALETALALLPHTKGVFTALGLPLEIEGALYNALLVVADGQILGVVPKQVLARTGLHYEPRWFTPWPAGKQTRLKLGGRDVRCGDLLFRLGEITLGFEVCEDAWAAEPLRPAPRLAARGANLILCPAASHFAFGKTAIRRQLGLDAAKRHGLAYLYANLMGNESGRVIFDGGAYVLDNQARLVAEGARFSHKTSGLCDAVMDFRGRPVEADAGLVDVGFRPEILKEAPLSAPLASATQAWEIEPHEELARAASLGLFDYLRKSKAKGFAISLSGGADSAACAVLVRLMAELGSKELGWAAFCQALPRVHGLAHAKGIVEAMPALLRTLYQATAQSGDVTRAAAQAVAEAVGSMHSAVEVQPLVDAYKALAEKELDRKLDWATDDLALQNLQARVRSPGIWLLANAEGRLLLATNNRSEAAAGYTTMDGDTSGGVAPVAGVGKHQLRAWLRWMETKGPAGLEPIPALKAVNAQAPTAELRPAHQGQTDEGDLMPYVVLDALEHAAIEERLSPLECWKRVAAAQPDQDAKQLKIWTRRFFQLWSQSQWKRERLALSFHLDDHNVDPRSWCRFPILNSGFEAELAELEQA